MNVTGFSGVIREDSHRLERLAVLCRHERRTKVIVPACGVKPSVISPLSCLSYLVQFPCAWGGFALFRPSAVRSFECLMESGAYGRWRLSPPALGQMVYRGIQSPFWLFVSFSTCYLVCLWVDWAFGICVDSTSVGR